MATYATTTDLKIAVLKRCGEVYDGSSDYDADAVTYLNNFHRNLIAGGNEFDTDCNEPWIWATAKSPQLLTLQLPYVTGSVAVTQGSPTITLSSPPSFSIAGWHLKIESRSDFFIVSSHTAGSPTATIDMPYTDQTATGLTFKLIQLQYTLPTPVMRFVGPMLTNKVSTYSASYPEQGQISELDYNSFIRKHPLMQLRCGIPTAFAVISRSPGDIVTVQFNGYLNAAADQPTRVEVPYIPLPADLVDSPSSIPLLPIASRDLLIHAASYMLMLDKSDNRSESEAALAKVKLQALISQNRSSLSLAGNSYGKVLPRTGGRRRRMW